MFRRVLCLLLLLALAAGPLRPAVAQGDAPAAESPTASETLLDILRDDAARAALIEQLEAAAASTESPDGTASAADQQTVAEQLVARVSGVVFDAADVVVRASAEIGRMAAFLARLDVGELSAPPRLVTLALTILAVLLANLLGEAVLAAVVRRNRITALTPLRRRAWLLVFFALFRVGSLALAWFAGYAVATWRAGSPGPAEAEAFFLSAVLIFGLCRIVLRVVVNPDAEREPSLSALHPRAQETIYRTLRTLIAAAVFSYMFLLPLVRVGIGFATVRPVRTLAATVLLVMALLALRRIVRTLDLGRDHDTHATGAAQALSRGVQTGWRALWPPLTMIYVLYCWLVAVTRPNDLQDIVFGGSLYTGAAVVLALVALRLMRTAGAFVLRLPAGLERTLPDLPRRLSVAVRVTAGALSVLMMLAALLTAIAAWGLIRPDRWLSDPTVQRVLWRVVSAGLVAVVLALFWAVIASIVDQRLRSATLVDAARSRTLLGLFRAAFTFAVGILGVMVVLSQLGIDIAPLLAGAGVIGLAIGFGSQKLVQDIITGVFIQMENAINEGDVVGVAGITGGVEKLTLRSVRLRTLDGAVHIVPFSSVDTVTNLTRDFAFHVAEIGVAYKERLPEVIEAMQDAFELLRGGPLAAGIIDDLEVQGVIALAESSVNVRVRIKTRPGAQWAIGRAYTGLVKTVFDERGIEFPFPHRQVMLPPDLPALLGLAADRPREREGAQSEIPAENRAENRAESRAGDAPNDGGS